MDRRTFLTTTAAGLATAHADARAQSGTRQFALASAAGLGLHNVTAVAATLGGKAGVRVRSDVRGGAQGGSSPGAVPAETLAVIEGLTFGDGVIEVEVAGTPRTDVFKDARGFVGMAFRLQADRRTYDAFYLRPTNGRADDQVRRNHSAQYISHPDWTWQRLRTETPERYESYVDLVPGQWTRMRIDVRGTQARLFVHGQAQPTLVVTDLKSGAGASGSVALWIDVSTDAHFRHLTVTG
jgi:hypothetical protein